MVLPSVTNEVVRMVELAYIMGVLLCNCFFYYFALFLAFFKIFHAGVYAKINGSDHYVLQVQISAILTILYAAKTPDVFHF